MGHRVHKAAHISHPAVPQTWSGSSSVPCGPLLPPILAHAPGKRGHTATYCSSSSNCGSLGMVGSLCFSLWQGIICAVPRETCISLPGPSRGL